VNPSITVTSLLQIVRDIDAVRHQQQRSSCDVHLGAIVFSILTDATINPVSCFSPLLTL